MMSGDTSVIAEVVSANEAVADLQTAQTLSEVDMLSEQIKQLSTARDDLLDQQNVAELQLQEKTQSLRQQQERLEQVEQQKKEVAARLAECEASLGSSAGLGTVPQYSLEHSDDGKITVKIKLPGVHSIADIDLDEEDNVMTLRADKWDLQLALPQVDPESAKAKFNKEKC